MNILQGYYQQRNMNRKYPPASKAYVLTLLVVLSTAFFSCSKSEDSLQLQKDLLDRYSALTWHLTSYAVAGVAQPLTTAQQHYTKKFVSDGSFGTSDGFMGGWNLTDVNTLVETYANFPAGVSASQTYTIATLNPTTLTLQYTNNGASITTVYTAGN